MIHKKYVSCIWLIVFVSMQRNNAGMSRLKFITVLMIIGLNYSTWLVKFRRNMLRPSSETLLLQSSWNFMAHGDVRDGEVKGKLANGLGSSTLHTTSELGVSSITTVDEHTSAASSRLNWRPRRFKWTHPFRRKKKSGFCTCAIRFQTHCNICKRFLTC